MTTRRAQLARTLEQLDPPTAPSCFVLLWTYFNAAVLSDVESALRADKIVHTRLRKHIAGSSLANDPPPEAARRLKALLPKPERFQRAALEWLIQLDRKLRDRPAKRFEVFELPGFDGKLYRVRRTNNVLAGSLAPRSWKVASQDRQGLSLLAHVWHHRVVPLEHSSGLRLVCHSEDEWGGRRVRDRLRQAKESQELSLLLWPFTIAPRYSGLDPSQPLPELIHLYGLDNETEIVDDVDKALDAARQQRATVLLFPELALSDGVEQILRLKLRQHHASGYPTLTLFGCCHRRNATDSLDVNEAVLLGPDGKELHRHRKLAPYLVEAEGRPCCEQLDTGKEVTVLESSLGNLVPMICLDLLNLPVASLVEVSHGNVFLVPSLSPKTTAHHDAAKHLRIAQKAATFVCNRWLDHEWNDDRPAEIKPEAVGTSFYRLPDDTYVAHLRERSRQPFLLFRLADDRDDT